MSEFVIRPMTLNHQLQSNLSPRGLSRIEAAAYVGLSLSAFAMACHEGKYPKATLPGKRWDRNLLDQVLDKLSGIVSKGDAMTSLDSWRESRGSRSPQGH